jgi:hypothetical protein
MKITKKIKNELVKALACSVSVLSTFPEGGEFFYALRHGEIISGNLVAMRGNKKIIVLVDNNKPAESLKIDSELIIFRVNFSNLCFIAKVRGWNRRFFLQVDLGGREVIYSGRNVPVYRYTYRPKKRPVKRKKRYKG